MGHNVFFLFIYLLQEDEEEIPGIDEFYTASEQIGDMYISLSGLILAIGAISGLLGGIRIYANWQAGKPRMDNEVSGWFLACLFLSLIGGAIRSFFGI